LILRVSRATCCYYHVVCLGRFEQAHSGRQLQVMAVERLLEVVLQYRAVRRQSDVKASLRRGQHHPGLLFSIEEAARLTLLHQEAGAALPVVAQEIHLGREWEVFAQAGYSETEFLVRKNALFAQTEELNNKILKTPIAVFH
jgi:hypothetical protein